MQFNLFVSLTEEIKESLNDLNLKNRNCTHVRGKSWTKGVNAHWASDADNICIYRAIYEKKIDIIGQNLLAQHYTSLKLTGLC